MSRRMRVLSVLSSSNQMYSGIGRAVFELADRLRDRVAFTFAIDDLNPTNADLVRRFAFGSGCDFRLGAGTKSPESLDNGNRDLESILASETWDAVECVCWANSATNDKLLRLIGNVSLVYTPHDQPSWTVPMAPGQAEHTEVVHRRVIRRADLVLCDSAWERGEIQRRAPDRDNATFLPLGCDFRRYQPGPPGRPPTLLFVGDLAEPRKRFDRVIAVLDRLIRLRADARLVVIGNRSEAAIEAIPPHLRRACDLRGYVAENDLRRAYAESGGLILLSDFEAFGIPILEALACATPVFLSRLEATQSLFSPFRAAHFCPENDAETTAEIIASAWRSGPAGIAQAAADRPRLEATFNWDVLAEAKWRCLKAAWQGRRGWGLAG